MRVEPALAAPAGCQGNAWIIVNASTVSGQIFQLQKHQPEFNKRLPAESFGESWTRKVLPYSAGCCRVFLFLPLLNYASALRIRAGRPRSAVGASVRELIDPALTTVRLWSELVDINQVADILRVVLSPLSRFSDIFATRFHRKLHRLSFVCPQFAGLRHFFGLVTISVPPGRASSPPPRDFCCSFFVHRSPRTWAVLAAL